MSATVAGRDDRSRRSRIALATAQAAALAVLIGAAASPPLASAASLLMLLAFAALPDAPARMRRVLAEPLGRGWLVFVVALLVGFAVGLARTPSTALHGLWDWRHLLLVPVALAVFDSTQAKRRLCLAVIVFAACAALVSLAMQIQGLAYKEGHLPGVLLRNSVTQAMTFGVAAFLALLLATTGQIAHRGARAVLGATGLGLLAMLLFAQSGRSGALAVLVMAGVTVLMLLRGRARLVAVIALPLLASAAYAASPMLQKRFTQAIHETRNAAHLPEYTSMGVRVIIWQTTADLIAQRPVLGTGLGGFPAAYAQRIGATYRDGWKALPTADPHNQYLFLWAEAGIAGLLGLLALLAGALRQTSAQPYRTAGVALLAAWCVTSLFSSHFQTFNEGHLIAVLLGAMLARTGPPVPAAATAPG
ncbi:MAG: O-antigen ligase family protein [Burkholderiaceae bacterium]|nr:O-antigen ligase family protein [Burkholderiaceae bacterium]